METAVLIFAGFFLLTATRACFAFAHGIQALIRSMRGTGAYAATLYFLALNLCEPLVNSLLIPFLISRTPSFRIDGASTVASSIIVSMPMGVLLIPAIGLLFDDPF